MAFAVVVTSDETRNYRDEVFTPKWSKFWAIISEWGISTAQFTDYSKIPKDIKAFGSAEQAEKFAKEFKGHPWWVVSIAYEIIEVKPRIIEVQDGWESAN